MLLDNYKWEPSGDEKITLKVRLTSWEFFLIAHSRGVLQVTISDAKHNVSSEYYWKRNIRLSTLRETTVHAAQESEYLPVIGPQTSGDVSKISLDNSLAQASVESGMESDVTFVSHGITEDTRPQDSDLISEKDILEAITVVAGDTSPFTVTFGPLLGYGIAGKVYQCYNHKTGKIVASKVLPISSENSFRQCLREIFAVKDLSHKHIIEFIGCDYVPAAAGNPLPQVRIFTAFAAGGSVARIVKSYGALSESVATNYIKQVLEGILYMHANGYTHRDIKGANLLLSTTGDIKIADFGSCKHFKLSVEDTELGSPTGQGTINWMAPEIINGVDGNVNWCATDIWSVGATLIELLSGRPPWNDATSSATVMIQIASMNPLDSLDSAIRDGISNKCKAFLKRCFTRDPNKRPTAKELLQDPLMKPTRSIGSELAYIFRDFYSQQVWRLRRIRVLEVLSLGFEGPSASARSSRSIYHSARAQEQELLSVNDIRRVIILCRKHLEATTILADDIMWSLRTLWGQWGNSSDLLLHRMQKTEELVMVPSSAPNTVNSNSSSQPKSWDARLLESIDLECLRTIGFCEEAARDSIRSEDPTRSQGLVISALRALKGIFGHSSAPLPAPIRPAPKTSLVVEDGVEVVEVDSNQQALLQSGMLLRWLAEARCRIEESNENTYPPSLSKYDCVMCTWRHAHQLGISISNCLLGLQTILLSCSAFSKHKKEWNSEFTQFDEGSLSQLLSYTAIATVSRAIRIHNAVCLLNEGRFFANMDSLLYEQSEARGDISDTLEDSMEFEETDEYNQLVVMALADYSPENDNELQLQEGDLIVVRHQHDSGWWEGETNGRIGWFPSNYCVIQHTLFPIEEEEPMSSRSDTTLDTSWQS